MNHFKIWSNFNRSNSPASKIKTWRLRWRSCAAKYHHKSSATTTAWLLTGKRVWLPFAARFAAVDAHQAVEFAHAQVAQDLHPLEGVDVAVQVPHPDAL